MGGGGWGGLHTILNSESFTANIWTLGQLEQCCVMPEKGRKKKKPKKLPGDTKSSASQNTLELMYINHWKP